MTDETKIHQLNRRPIVPNVPSVRSASGLPLGAVSSSPATHFWSPTSQFCTRFQAGLALLGTQACLDYPCLHQCSKTRLFLLVLPFLPGSDLALCHDTQRFTLKNTESTTKRPRGKCTYLAPPQHTHASRDPGPGSGPQLRLLHSSCAALHLRMCQLLFNKVADPASQSQHLLGTAHSSPHLEW